VLKKLIIFFVKNGGRNMRIDLSVCPSCHKEKSFHDMEKLVECMQNFIKNELGSPVKKESTNPTGERN